MIKSLVIQRSKDVLGGTPVFFGTRVPVAVATLISWLLIIALGGCTIEKHLTEAFDETAFLVEVVTLAAYYHHETLTWPKETKDLKEIIASQKPSLDLNKLKNVYFTVNKTDNLIINIVKYERNLENLSQRRMKISGRYPRIELMAPKRAGEKYVAELLGITINQRRTTFEIDI